jgi:hypothetical protein
MSEHTIMKEMSDYLAKKYAEDPSKSGEIRQLSDDELQNLPSHMITVNIEEQELLEQIPQRERASTWRLYQLVKSQISYKSFLRKYIDANKHKWEKEE